MSWAEARIDILYLRYSTLYLTCLHCTFNRHEFWDFTMAEEIEDAVAVIEDARDKNYEPMNTEYHWTPWEIYVDTCWSIGSCPICSRCVACCRLGLPAPEYTLFGLCFYFCSGVLVTLLHFLLCNSIHIYKVPRGPLQNIIICIYSVVDELNSCKIS